MDARPVPTDAVPLTILTGFLGAGKTSLLNRILRDAHGARIAVLVNDFGALNIDGDLIVGVQGGAVTLANGCICCSIRDDLLRSVLELLQLAVPPEHIVIECSGVSEPAAVAATFHTPRLRALVRVASVIALVDAEQVHTYPEHADLIEEQIAAADVVIINKIDLATPTLRAGLREWITMLVPQARILEATHAEVPLELLFDYAPTRADVPHTHAHHDHPAFATWSFQSALPFRTSALQRALLTLPTTVFRAKGVLALTTPAEQRSVLQLVGRRFSVTPGAPWGDEPARTRLVLIGNLGVLDPAVLQRHFEACLATP